MNTETPATDCPLDAIKQAKAVRAAHIKRMAEKAADWAKRPNNDYRQYAFLDALTFCVDNFIGDEVHDAMSDLRNEIRIDEDGVPLTGDGYPISGADRVYIPLKAITAEEAIAADEPQTPWGPLSQVVVTDDEGNEWPVDKAWPDISDGHGDWVVCFAHFGAVWYFTKEGEAGGSPYKIKGSRADGGAV